jgi:UDP-glucose 4-epimerase
MVQVVHERDVVRAIELALQPGRRGVYNVRGPGEVPLSSVFRLAGRRPVRLPSLVAQRALSGLWESRLGTFPEPELDHVRYICMVDDTLARKELGYAHRFDLEQTVNSVFDEW